MKKIIAMTLCLCLCLAVLTSCGLGEDEKGPSIQLYLADFPQTLDPALVHANPDVTQLLSLLFEPLTTIDEDGDVSGALASDWYSSYDYVNEEYAIYFELEETFWSNSNQVTADDVIYAWKRILSPNTESPYASLLYCIKNAKAVKAGIMTSDDLGITAEDDTLLKVVFEDAKDFSEEEQKEYGIYPYVYDDATHEAACQRFVETVANVHLSPVKEDVVKRYTNHKVDGDDRIYQWGDYSAASIVSNGPFKVQAYEIGNKLVLERNNYYRLEEEMAVDKHVTPYRLTIYYYEGQLGYAPNAAEGLTQEQYQSQRYDNGEIFLLSAFNKDNYGKYADDMETASTTNGYAYLFNTKTITDANVRKALSAALNRNEIVTNITATGEIAATGYVPAGVYDTESGTDFRGVGGDLYANYTMDNAKSWANGAKSYKLIYLIPDDIKRYGNYYDIRDKVQDYNVYAEIANYAVAKWGEIGIKVTATGLTYDAYMEALKTGDFDIIGYSVIMDSTDALAYLAPFATMYSGRIVPISLDSKSYTPGYTNLEDADYDALIDKAAYTADPAQRAQALHDAEAKLVELCPATMLYYHTTSYVAKGDLKSIGDADYFGSFSFIDASLKNWREINAKEDAESAALEEANNPEA